MKVKKIPYYGDSRILRDFNCEIREVDYEPVFIQGNEACVEAAIIAGLGFYGGYPITPSSEIAEIFSRRLPQDGKIFIQMEDEIASIASCIGASIGGLKSMTATSGPGFSLMQENIGYAVMAEIPVVVVNVQRLGPSTGAASSPAQGDLMQARWGTHGDHPILVLAPGSVKETFELTILAFNFAERLRTPVILLSDEVIGHMREKILIPPSDYILLEKRKQPFERPANYRPYSNDEDVPAMAEMGHGYRHHITGLLHDQNGFPTNSQDEIAKWYDRIYRKFDANMKDIFMYNEYMTEDADILIISFGISSRISCRAAEMARERGIKAGSLQLLTLWPIDEDYLSSVIKSKKAVIVPEMNRGQLFYDIDRLASGRVPIKKVNRTDGHMIDPEAILEVME